jgi:hypothetical protein
LNTQVGSMIQNNTNSHPCSYQERRKLKKPQMSRVPLFSVSYRYIYIYKYIYIYITKEQQYKTTMVAGTKINVFYIFCFSKLFFLFIFRLISFFSLILFRKTLLNDNYFLLFYIHLIFEDIFLIYL